MDVNLILRLIECIRTKLLRFIEAQELVEIKENGMYSYKIVKVYHRAYSSACGYLQGIRTKLLRFINV